MHGCWEGARLIPRIVFGATLGSFGFQKSISKGWCNVTTYEMPSETKIGATTSIWGECYGPGERHGGEANLSLEEERGLSLDRLF